MRSTDYEGTNLSSSAIDNKQDDEFYCFEKRNQGGRAIATQENPFVSSQDTYVDEATRAVEDFMRSPT